MRPLRIAFVADTLYSPVGGGVVSGLRFVEGLRARHQVIVVGADAAGPDALQLPGFQLPVSAMRRMHFVMARPVRSSLRSLVSDVDVVHLQFPFWLSMTALREARRAGCPVVAAFHVQPENVFSNVGLRWEAAMRAAYRLWVKHFYGLADAVVCPSRFAEEKLKAHGLSTPTVVISNGVPPDVAVLRPDLAKRTEHVLLLAIGRLAAEKRHDVLIDAVRTCRHRDRIRLVIAGAGPLEAELQRRAQGLPRPATIGYLPRERLLQHLVSADLFVHCSEVELEGIAVLEAMSAGVPVIVAESAESAASAFALNEQFRFPAGDVRALADRIDRLLDAPQVLEAARRSYRTRAEGYDFQRSVADLARVYESVSPPGAPAPCYRHA